MAKEFEVVEKGKEKEVIRDYLKFWNASEVGRIHGISKFNVLRYIAWVKKNKPELFDEAEEATTVNVIAGLADILQRIERKMNAWENDPEREAKYIKLLETSKSTFESYGNMIEKIVKYNDDKRTKDALIQAISEAEPEIGQRIIELIKSYKEKRALLS